MIPQIYDWFGLNRAIFLWINHGGGYWRDQFALAGTFAGNHRWFPVVMALVLGLSLWRPQWLHPYRVLVLSWAYLLDWWIVGTLKPLVNFPRPLAALGPQWVHVLGKPEFHHSFPSGHTAWAFLLLGSLWPGTTWPIRIALLFFAIWVGWSRIAVGAHFPADVLGGACIGLTCAVVSSLLLWPWRSRVQNIFFPRK